MNTKDTDLIHPIFCFKVLTFRQIKTLAYAVCKKLGMKPIGRKLSKKECLQGSSQQETHVYHVVILHKFVSFKYVKTL